VSDPERSEDEERARAIALLEANHAFPTDYALSVIARNAEEIAALVVAAVFEDGFGARPPGAHERLPSSGGKYISHRLTIRCEDAAHVLRVYARLRAIDGVLTIL
jgi:putative lipoic acid-binding regulatory protein